MAKQATRLAHELPTVSSEIHPTHEDIAARAYAQWQEKGCPEGTHEERWLIGPKRIEGEPRGRRSGNTKLVVVICNRAEVPLLSRGTAARSNVKMEILDNMLQKEGVQDAGRSNKSCAQYSSVC